MQGPAPVPADEHEELSVYRTPEIRRRLLEIYDDRMRQWPVPHEDRVITTSRGRVHVIISGPSQGAPVLLLHASGVGSWSWKYNVEALSGPYRTYAIDLMGDAGYSGFFSADTVMKTGRDQADLYVEILDALGLDRVRVVGASEGGFIASNLALHAPHRVERVALLGPMGYAGSISTVLRIMFAQLVPLDSVRDKTFRWAFSDSPELEAEFGEWFRLLMKGVKPRKVPPLPLRAPDRQKISVPVLFVFGTKDHLVGDPETARERVQDMQDVRVAIVEAGHLMAAERPAEIDRLLLDFLAES